MYSNIYFIGIGGIGMSAIARYYKFKGLNVSGYDRTETELTRKLCAEGIGVHYTDSPELIPNPRGPAGTCNGTPEGIQGGQALPYAGRDH